MIDHRCSTTTGMIFSNNFSAKEKEKVLYGVQIYRKVYIDNSQRTNKKLTFHVINGFN